MAVVAVVYAERVTCLLEMYMYCEKREIAVPLFCYDFANSRLSHPAFVLRI